ncbi:MAG: GntR family transcriptional regulator [Limnochordia bacterium]
MLPISLQAQGSAPFYQQIVDQIQNLILSGKLSPETPLPSVRGLAQQLSVSVITIRRAYAELERAGLIFTRPGMGSFVAKQTQAQRHDARQQHVRALLENVLAEAENLGLPPDQVKLLLVQMLAEEPNRSSDKTVTKRPRKDAW